MIGGFVGRIDVDPGPGEFFLQNEGSFTDHFLTRFTADGDFVWAYGWGSRTGESIWGIDLDGLGDIHTAGDFLGTVDFDPSEGEDIHESNGSVDCFVRKFSPDGYTSG